jgi:hypothetical protein
MISGWIDLDQFEPLPDTLAGGGSSVDLTFPGLGLCVDGGVSTWIERDCLIASSGTPRFPTDSLARVARERGHAAAWKDLYMQRGTDAPVG